jgi:hypothetical protein
MMDWLRRIYRILWPVLPSGKPWLVYEQARNNWKASSIHALNGALLLAAYDNKSRTDSWLLKLVGTVATQIHKSGAETYGYGDPYFGRIYLPAEDKDAPAMSVGIASHDVKPGARQPAEYGARQTEGYCCYIPRGSGKWNELWRVPDMTFTGIRFLQIGGIVSGLVRVDNDWIACCIDRGIQSSKGWHNGTHCTELAVINGTVLAFLRNGDVRHLNPKTGVLGKTIAKTGTKPMRAVLHEGLLYWITMGADEVWVTNGNRSKRVAQLGGKPDNPSANGSLFGTSICTTGDRIYTIRSMNNNGIQVHEIRVG